MAEGVHEGPEIASATAQFRRFLERAIETAPTSAPKYAEVAIPECDPDGEQGDALWVADFKILSISASGADMLARAVLITVAEQHEDTISANSTVVQARIRLDTLTWKMSRRPPSAEWRVCGFASNGFDLGSYGRPELVRYVPPGVTRSRLLAQIDSIRRARSAK